MENSSAASLLTMRYSRLLRLWHWLLAILIFGSISTLLYSWALFGDDEKRPPAGEEVKQTAPAFEKAPEGGQAPFDFAKLPVEERIALQLRHQIFEGHKWIGFGLAFLLLSRGLIEVSTRKDERIITRLKKAMKLQVQTADDKQIKNHYLLVKWGYIVFYIILTVLAVTGLIMAFEHVPLFDSRSVQGPAHELHENFQFLMYAYIVLHIAGVIRADMRRQKGIVSAMINGGE